MKIGIFSGSLDPFTNGHLWIVQQAASLFDEFILNVGSHRHKEPMIPRADRIDLLKSIALQFNSVRVVETKNPVRYAISLALDGEDVTMVRGCRNEKDFVYEQGVQRYVRFQAQTNGVQLRQLLLLCPEEMSQISSTRIREAVQNKNWDEVRALTPPEVGAYLIHGNTCLADAPAS